MLLSNRVRVPTARASCKKSIQFPPPRRYNSVRKIAHRGGPGLVVLSGSAKGAFGRRAPAPIARETVAMQLNHEWTRTDTNKSRVAG